MKATLPTIAQQIRAMIESAGIYSTRPPHDLPNLERHLVNARDIGATFGSTYINFEQAWGVSASLSIHPRIEAATRRDRQFKRLRLDIELNAPAMNSDIPTMTAKIALLRRVTDLASLIHTAFDGMEIEETPSQSA